MIQKTLEGLYNNRVAEKYINFTIKDKKVIENGIIKTIPRDNDANYKKLQDYVPIGLMAWLSLVQCAFFARSKEMPDDKKATLISNEIYTAALGVAISLAALKHTKNLTEKIRAQAENMFKGMQQEKQITNGIKTAVPIVFAVAFCQYLAPIVTTPFATKTTQYLIKKGKIKDPNEQKPLDVEG